ncbi:MAG: LL-diaminopimelate aminotransferase, partial [Clostridiales bacterium]|nr:LL-diaminopimelate aminotransferase [Clostridiales bacterium]
MVKVNQNFTKLPGGYLFPEIGRRVRAFSAQNPPKPLIRLGIGDVTQPLAPAVIQAMEQATAEMGRKETFRGY